MKPLAVLFAAATTMTLAVAAKTADPRVTVAQGALEGTVDDGVNVFLGVPFAAPPVGDLRWHVEPGPESGRYGAFHTSDVPYEFNTLHLSPGRTFTDVDRRLADQFSSYVEAHEPVPVTRFQTDGVHGQVIKKMLA